MMLSGLQKLTLLDYPGLLACTVFTGGCDLRCPFCHNASLVLPDRIGGGLSEDELMAFLRKRRGVLDGVAVTGGEPLMHPELPALLGRIRELGYKVKVDTNGTFPKRLREIVEAGLADRVAMDIKNSPEKYPATAGIPGLDTGPIMESAAFLLGGSADYEFRTTVVRGLHEKDDFKKIGAWIRGAKAYYLQAFKDSGDLVAAGNFGAFTEEEMKELADIVRPYVPSVKIRGV